MVEVEEDPAQTKGSVLIDHHPRGLGFMTKYLHITRIRVSEGEFVGEGEPFAVGLGGAHRAPSPLRALGRGGPRRSGAPGDTDLAPIDPTRALYAWEQRLEPDESPAGGQVPLSIGTVRVNTFPFFFVRLEGDVTVHVPLYEPMTEEERVIVALLGDAHRHGNPVELSFRRSAFWGLDVVTQVAHRSSGTWRPM